MGILVGIMLNEITAKSATRIYQTLILLPQLISIIIIAYIVFGFLSNESGFLNKVLFPALGANRINFYNEKKYWPFILIFVQIWKSLGYNSIIYFSSILSIDRNIYEAATVDGASHMQQIWHVTLPMIKATAITLILMNVGRIFYSDFGLFYQIPMDSGPLYQVTNTIDTYVYRALIQQNNIGMSSAAGAFQSVIGFCIVITANMIVRKIDSENALF
jgi:putative aldouronate transport system permease protein